MGRTAPNLQPLASVAEFAVPAIDRVALFDEDVQRAINGQAARYAVPFVADVTAQGHGSWEQVDAAWSLWRLRVRAPEASHINLGFTRCKLPSTARLMVYSADYQSVVRPFDTSDVCPDGQLWTPIVNGDEIVVELYVQTAQRPLVDLQIGHVGSGYRFFGAGESALAETDGSGSCNIDVVCPQGASWTTQIAAVAAISSGGFIFCTGVMVNNTAQDGRDFFLTANHCGVSGGTASSLVCYWNYENSSCNGPENGPLNQFTTGSVVRASYSPSDMTLVELNNSPNPSWGVGYAGWSRSNSASTSAVAIHHPSGDPKKISFENQATQITSYGGSSSPGNGSHVRVVDWDSGTTEPGSSGSPLFDQNKRIIGQLHGGGAACGNNLSDWYGRFTTSWTGGGSNSSRLSNWLDPIGTGAVTLDALGSGPSGNASATPYGQGCYEQNASFLEEFGAGTFDLAGNAFSANVIRFTPTGSPVSGYTVAQAPSAWRNPTTADLGLGDDSVTSAQFLGFGFQYPGGLTAQTRMCSNGYVWLNGSTSTADWSPTTAELVSEPARLCPLWMDLNPASGGTTHFDVTPGAVYYTWLNVPAFGAAGSSFNVQMVLRSNGQVEYRWLDNSSNTDAIVGWSPGGGVTEPASRDISTTMPFTTGPDSLGLKLVAVNLPIQGSNLTLRTEDIPAGSVFASVFLGFQQYPSGLDLTSLGLPGCRQYSSLDISFGVPIFGSQATTSIGIPSSSVWTGVHLYATSATLTSGFNQGNALTANGVDLLIDVN